VYPQGNARLQAFGNVNGKVVVNKYNAKNGSLMKDHFNPHESNTVEVFKTNIRKSRHAVILAELLARQFPACKINFDLKDCDKILRVEGQGIQPDRIIETLRTKGYRCEVLAC
jgi:hypothetical protein